MSDPKLRNFRLEIATLQQLVHTQHAEIERLRGVCNLLADKLGRYTGYPVPVEMRQAEKAERAGCESFDGIRNAYVDACGRKPKAGGDG